MLLRRSRGEGEQNMPLVRPERKEMEQIETAAMSPFRNGVAAVLVVLIGLMLALTAAPAHAQETGAEMPREFALPVRTDSPRETFATFQRLSAEMETELVAYIAEPSFAGVVRLALLSDQMNGLLDLEAEAASSRREIGIRTMTYLMDIFGRIPVIDPSGIPDSDQMEADGQTALRIPGTPVYIMQITEGERQGEYLFAASTVDVAPRFFRAVQALPLRTDLPIQSLTSLGPQLTGPLVPPQVVAAVPSTLRVLWLDTPAWKVLTTILAILVIGILVAATFRVISALTPESRLGRLALQAMLPIAILVASGIALPAFAFQINLSGRFADVLNSVQTLLTYMAYAWLFWVSVRLVFEVVILSPRIPDTSLDANLLRLVANVLGAIGVVVIVAFGGQSIGIPILSILAGLGIGGLAMALALRPTLENLVGGVILYLDRPVRVGDFCRFGDQIGTIEAIGLRSTKLRAPDRTLITVPNAQFADMQIVNFAHCDQMLITDTICLRYETRPDQLRYLLAQLRLMLHAHPRIDSDTIRVRFAGYGPSALNIDMRVYVQTREWNDFFAVREDVYLRIADLVADAGTDFAFPSQTIYLGKDRGLDDGQADAAASVVQGWRDAGNLPFPTLPEADLARVDGSLDYPPRGSHVLRVDSSVPETTPETLSAEPDTEDRANRQQR
jgi:MscS family membrane protein